jgi:hypothetical protein
MKPRAPDMRSTTAVTRADIIPNTAVTIFCASAKIDVPTARTLWKSPANIENIPWNRFWSEDAMLVLWDGQWFT